MNKLRKEQFGEITRTFSAAPTRVHKGELVDTEIDAKLNQLEERLGGIENIQIGGDITNIQPDIVNILLFVIRNYYPVMLALPYVGGPGISILGRLISVDIDDEAEGLMFHNGPGDFTSRLKVKPGRGITITDSNCTGGVSVELDDTTPGLEFVGGDDCNDKINVKPGPGIALNADDYGTQADIGDGLTFSTWEDETGKVQVNLDAENRLSGLNFADSSNEDEENNKDLVVNVHSGLAIDDTEIEGNEYGRLVVDLASSFNSTDTGSGCGLTFDGTELQVAPFHFLHNTAP